MVATPKLKKPLEALLRIAPPKLTGIGNELILETNCSKLF